MAKQDEITTTAETSVAAGLSYGTPPPHSNYPEYTDRTISTRDWAVRTFTDVPGQLISYLVSLFPILTWIYRYNLTWLAGDVIAGLTVGAVVVPQGMSYALIATLPPEYGLYSSFIGVFIYCFFATSKDVTIGPVAVMSLEVAKVIAHVKHNTGDQYTNAQIASSLAIICGIISAGIGFLRIGFILEFIPAPAVAGFMTGSAFTIATGQVPALLGISKRFNTRDSAYRVVINTLKNLPHTSLDAAFGLTALFALYFIRWACDKAGERWPQHRRAFFFTNVMRNGVVVIVATIAAYLITRNEPPKQYRISILKTVPRGFKAIGTPTINSHLLSGMAGQLPVATIILLLEHIAIAKSFGRINDYKIIPDQEVIAIGLTNIVGSFFGAYPATGSFSRTALKSKSGVRTPAAGIITGIVVLLALYALTDAFYFIPLASLSAVIIHAVGDLMSHPRQLFIFWRVQPIEAIIFLAAVFITIFTSIENGIYVAIATSAALLLYRIARPRGQFLGRLRLSDGQTTKEVYVPLDRRTINPDVKIRNPPPGVIIYRFSESFTYPNSSTQCDVIVDEIKRVTKRGKANAFPTLGDRPWNDIGPRAGFDAEAIASDKRPILRAIIFDMSAVSTIDTTGIQSFVDTRRQINKYADREVEYHFANIISPWVRRALIAGGFGTGTPLKEIVEIAPVVPSSAISSGRSKGISSLGNAEVGLAKRVKQYLADTSFRDGRFQLKDDYDLENEDVPEKDEHWGVLMPQETPFFHIDIPDLSLPEYDQPRPRETYEEKLKTDSNCSRDGSPRLGDGTFSQ